MESSRAIRIDVFDRANTWKGRLGNPVSASFTQRYLAQPSGEVTVDTTDPILPALLDPGAWVRVQYDPLGRHELMNRRTNRTFMTGRVRDPRGSLLPSGTVTVSISDDWRVLRNTLAWVQPAGRLKPNTYSDLAQATVVDYAIWSPGTIEGLSGAFSWEQRFGTSGVVSAEAAVRALLEPNLARIASTTGQAFTVSQGTQGGDVRAILPRVRFGTVEEYIVPLLASQGLRLDVRHDDDGTSSTYRLTVTTPKTWPRPFTPDSGVLRDGEWSLAYPNATDIVIGGPGEDVARAFRGAADTARSALYAERIEILRDSTNAPIFWPDKEDYIEPGSFFINDDFRLPVNFHLLGEGHRLAAFEAALALSGMLALAEGAPTSGVSLTLAETPAFRFSAVPEASPEFFMTGDVVTVAPSRATALRGLSFTERITETTIGLSRDKGLTITPGIGTRKDDPTTQMALAIRALAAANRRNNAA